jgi:hypothetical protein
MPLASHDVPPRAASLYASVLRLDARLAGRRPVRALAGVLVVTLGAGLGSLPGAAPAPAQLAVQATATPRSRRPPPPRSTPRRRSPLGRSRPPSPLRPLAWHPPPRRRRPRRRSPPAGPGTARRAPSSHAARAGRAGRTAVRGRPGPPAAGCGRRRGVSPERPVGARAADLRGGGGALAPDGHRHVAARLEPQRGRRRRGGRPARSGRRPEPPLRPDRQQQEGLDRRGGARPSCCRATQGTGLS